jgi:polyisoprenyl-phosphate glycosyltransferase
MAAKLQSCLHDFTVSALIRMNRDMVATIDLSIVVPVYRSEAMLPQLVNQIRNVLEKSKYRFEVLLVNDCSPDGSWRVIQDLAKTSPFVRGVSLRKNFGQHNATMAGLRFARGAIVVIMDDDLQHPPASILSLAKQIENGADVCYTNYRGRKHALWKILGSRLNDKMATWLLKKPKGLYLSSFKAISKNIVDEILSYDGPYTYIDGLIIASTNSITSIDIDHQIRWSGKGNYNIRRSLSLWLKMAMGSSIVPLRFATITGFSFSIISALVFMYVIVERLSDPQIQPGWTSLIATVLLIGGVQMFFLGIIGEYVGRIYIRLNRYPQFVIDKTTFDVSQDVGRDMASHH